MKTKQTIIITVFFTDEEELQLAWQAINYHFASLIISTRQDETSLTVEVEPIDRKLFAPEEALDIMRQTLALSPYLIRHWEITLNTNNSIH